LVNKKLNAGIHEVEFDGSDFTSGVYFYTINYGGKIFSSRMALIK